MEDIIRKTDYMQETIDLIAEKLVNLGLEITENTTLAEMATMALEFLNSVPVEEESV
jgi:hypothetical protein